MNLRLVLGTLAVAVCAATVASASPTAYFERESLLAMWQLLPSPGMSTPLAESVELTLFGVALSALAFRLRRRNP
jgi:hypothetical protein